jgi:Uma2 family endonuclease
MSTIATPEVFEELPLIVPDDALYEIIDGRIVEKPPMGTYPVEVATILVGYLEPFVREARLGRMMTECLFRIAPKTQYRPDLAFISDAKWPVKRRSPRPQPWEIIPDLAIEIISENDKAEEVMGKTYDYFQAGVRLVWIIYTDPEVIHVYHSFTQIQVLTGNDVLDGGEVLPGFELPLPRIFLEENPPA